MLLGFLADGASRLTGQSLPVSSVRVRKFCSTTSFSSNKYDLEGFEPPFSLMEGLERTLESEFISPNPNRETFFTE